MATLQEEGIFSSQINRPTSPGCISWGTLMVKVRVLVIQVVLVGERALLVAEG